jgi:predicted solute-binding protein
MLAIADAALLIGDAALLLDHRAHGVEKLDLGALWTDMTGLPFVWAFWAGRPDAATAATVELLQQSAAEGLAHLDEIGAAYCAGDPGWIPVAQQYLRENLTYDLSERSMEGLQTYYREAAELGLVRPAVETRFF